MFNPLTRSEENGVKAIIYLQKVGGIDYPKEDALREWRKMTSHEQDWTVRLYRIYTDVDKEREEKKNARLRQNPEAGKP